MDDASEVINQPRDVFLCVGLGNRNDATPDQQND